MIAWGAIRARNLPHHPSCPARHTAGAGCVCPRERGPKTLLPGLSSHEEAAGRPANREGDDKRPAGRSAA